MKELVSPEVARIAPYEPGKPLEELERELGSAWPKEGAIKLASNENPLGPSPLARAAAEKALLSTNLYPDGGSFYLRQKIADFLGVALGQVVAGSGSNELIDLLVSTYVAPDEEVIAPAYSFSCYRLAAEAHRRAFRETPNGADFAYDLDALVDGVGPKTKLVFLANPNNPTGVYAAGPAMRRLCERLPPNVLLAVDEAYLEYVRAGDYESSLGLLAARERLVVMRTFSKIYGLAGLRVGYLVGRAEVVQYLHRIRLPFNVSSVGQAAARAALDDKAHVEKAASLNAREIVRVEGGLRALGLAVVPSQTNFVLVDMGARDGRDVFQRLLKRGVIVRPMGGYGLPHHLRISIGTEPENSRLLETLREVL